jgi:hypothetical protein
LHHNLDNYVHNPEQPAFVQVDDEQLSKWLSSVQKKFGSEETEVGFTIQEVEEASSSSTTTRASVQVIDVDDEEEVRTVLNKKPTVELPPEDPEDDNSDSREESSSGEEYKEKRRVKGKKRKHSAQVSREKRQRTGISTYTMYRETKKVGL